MTSYETNGDLKSFLTRQGADYLNAADVGATASQQLNIARQIVQGASYLDAIAGVSKMWELRLQLLFIFIKIYVGEKDQATQLCSLDCLVNLINALYTCRQGTTKSNTRIKGK